MPRATLTTKSGAAAALGNVRICPRLHWRWICSEVSTNLGWRNSASCNCQPTVSTCQTPSVTHPPPNTRPQSSIMQQQYITDTTAKGSSRDATSSSAKFMEPDSSLQPAVCTHPQPDESTTTPLHRGSLTPPCDVLTAHVVSYTPNMK